jgi:hypothetical protein
LEAGSYVFVGTRATRKEIQQLNQHDCVVRTMKISELEQVLDDVQNDLDSERDDEFQKTQITRTLEKKDVTDKDELRQYLTEKQELEQRETTTEIQSEYQLYVTPDADAVKDLADELESIQEIYDEALSWVWVSEEYLNGEQEYWFTPEEFLVETPDMKTNPSHGTPVSDCSEQANTLASLLLAYGLNDDNVRVVLGKVNFNGQIGGHAWVEMYENGRWIPLEATAGAYYYEETDTVSEAMPLSYTYFTHHTFPAITIWYYYNNVYFMDNTGQEPTGTYPDHWSEESRSYLKDDLKNLDSETLDSAKSNGRRE